MTFQTSNERERFITSHMGLACRVLHDTFHWHGIGYHEPADMLQEAYVALTKAVDTYDEKYGTTFSTYAYAVIRRHLISMARHAKAGKRIEQITDDFSNVSDNEEPICHNYSDDISHKVLYGAVNQLSPPLREVIIEHVINRRTFMSIGRRLGISKQAVQQRYKKALTSLRYLLEQSLDN